MRKTYLPLSCYLALVFVAVLLICSPPALRADVHDYAITVDTYVDSQSVTSSYGTSTSMKALVNDSNDTLCHAMFQLPASTWSYPADEVVSATVYLRASSVMEVTSQKAQLYPLTHDFTLGATWQTYDGTNNWPTTSGGDYSVATYAVGSGGGTNSWYTFDITSMLSNSNLQDHGALLRLDDETFYGGTSMPRYVFRTSDYTADTSLRPYVEVITTPEPATWVLLLLGGGAAVLCFRRRRNAPRTC